MTEKDHLDELLNNAREKEGSVWTDEGGELDDPVLTCMGCVHYLVHDFHYYFCDAQGGQKSYWIDRPVVQLRNGPNSGCPFPTPPKP